MAGLSERFKTNVHTSDIFLAMRPIFLISKCFGTYNYSHSKIYKNVLLINTFIMIIFVTLASVYSFIFIDSDDAEWYSNIVFFYMDKSHIIILYICFITTIYFHLFKQEKLGKELLHIDNIDTYLKTQNFNFIYFIVNHVWVGLFLIMVVFILWLIDYFLYTNSHSHYARIQLLSMYIPFLVMNSSIAQWYSIIKLISDHFIFITFGVLSTTDHQRLSALIKVHGRLCTVTRRINNLFGPSLFVWITYIFIMITQYTFLVMKVTVTYSRQQNDFNYSAALAAFDIGLFFSLWAIIYSCYRASTEADVFTRTLYRLTVKDDVEKTTPKEMFHLQISMKNDLVFHAWNFFQINLSLFYSMISAAATLLVILIQFDMTQTSEEVDIHTFNSTS